MRAPASSKQVASHPPLKPVCPLSQTRLPRKAFAEITSFSKGPCPMPKAVQGNSYLSGCPWRTKSHHE